jgi:hypothetical protein
LRERVLQASLRGREGVLRDQRGYVIEDTNHWNIAPYIEFRLHRTISVYVKVQNRYLEQVVVVTSKLSASRFWILESTKTFSREMLRRE